MIVFLTDDREEVLCGVYVIDHRTPLRTHKIKIKEIKKVSFNTGVRANRKQRGQYLKQENAVSRRVSLIMSGCELAIF